MHGNGSSPGDPIERLIAELEQELAPIESQRAELEEKLSEISEREQRINGAIDALTGKRPGKPAAKPARRPSIPGGQGKNWTPSAETIEQVFEALKTGGQMNCPQVAEQISSSPDTARRAIDRLRLEERVRLVGKAGRGGAYVYEVMPDA